MARYTGPKARRWRRLGQVPSDGAAAAVGRRNYPPGQHGLKRQQKLSEYATQLREKQKAKYTFGLQERQFASYYRKADKKTGITGENLMRLLELRLDNVLYRLGLAKTRTQARQVVNHGHVLVDQRKVTIPSYQLRPEQRISLKPAYHKLLQEALDQEALKNAERPDWLQLEAKTLIGTVLKLPERAELDASINEQLIVEYYSR